MQTNSKETDVEGIVSDFEVEVMLLITSPDEHTIDPRTNLYNHYLRILFQYLLDRNGYRICVLCGEIFSRHLAEKHDIANLTHTSFGRMDICGK